MNLYNSLLKAFLNKDIYVKYKDYVDTIHIKENYPEIAKLYHCLPSLHESSVPQRTLDDLELALFTLYPRTDAKDYQQIFKILGETNVAESQVISYLEAQRHRVNATKIATTALQVSEGQKEHQDLQELLDELQSEATVEEASEEYGLIEMDIEAVYARKAAEPGLTWPLESLNQNLGDLTKGTFGFVFARPETGKTTFLATIAPFMAKQVPGHPVLWLNNEEKGDKVVTRIFQSALGLTQLELQSDLAGAQRKFFELTDGNLKFIWDTGLTKQRVERLCKKYEPSLIIYDQIDKIQGFHKEERNDLDLKAIYVWARQLAQQYAPSIAICQAGITGEHKRWLTMGDVDNSKTGKQGEADFILGIGKVPDEGLEGVRYLHLSKNKLKGTHSKWEVRIKPEIGRYEDF